jgi:hypothetical protein
MHKQIVVLISQIIFNILKVLEIKYTYQNRIKPLLINSVFINIVSLLSVYYAIDDLLKGNFAIVFFYIVGSVIGKYIGMKLNKA